MLTQEQIDKLKSASPKTPSGNINASSVGASDFLNQILSKNKPNNKIEDTRAWYDPRRLIDAPVRLASEAGQGIGLAGAKIYEQFLSPEDKIKFEQKLQKATAQEQKIPLLGTTVPALKDLNTEKVAGQVVGTAGLLTGNPLLAGAALGAGSAMEEGKGTGEVLMNTAIGAASGKVLEVGFKMAQPQIQKAISKYGIPAFEKLSAYIPDSMKDAYKFLAEKATSGVENIGSNIPEVPLSGTISKMQEGISNVNKNINSKISNITKNPINKIKDVLEVPAHTLDELKLIPESEVGKLNIREQNAWTKLQKKDIVGAKKDLLLESSKEVETKMGSNSASRELAIEKETSAYNKDIKNLKTVSEALDRKLTKSSLETAVKERPTMRKLLKDQGDKYASLYEKDIAPVKNVVLNKNEIFSKIDSKLPGNIDTTERDIANKIKEAIKFDKNGNVKLGELNKQIKSLKPKGKFNQINTNINDALSGLGELMEEKGADFSKSNKFWSEWVGVKEKIKQKFNPFESSPINAKVGGDLIRGIAEGKMPEEREFMNIIRENIGRDLTSKEKDIVNKIKLNEEIIGEHGIAHKAELQRIEADKIYQDSILKHQEEVDKGLIDGAIQERLDKLEAMKWENRTKAIVRKFITGVLSYAGIKVAEKVTGIDVPYIPGI